MSKDNSIIHKFNKNEYDLVLFYLSIPKYFRIGTYVFNPQNSSELQSYQIVGINIWKDEFVDGIVGDVFFRKCTIQEALKGSQKYKRGYTEGD